MEKPLLSSDTFSKMGIKHICKEKNEIKESKEQTRDMNIQETPSNKKK